MYQKVRKNWKKILILIILGLLLISVLGISIYISTPYKPTDFSFEKVQEQEKNVKISDKENYIQIEPIGNNLKKEIGIIFYPGARVDPTSYIKNMSEIARQTKSIVFITKPLFNFAILNSDIANLVINDQNQISTWFIGGHSLGGVSAEIFIGNNPEIKSIKGIFFFASYPADEKIKDRKDLSVLSIYGSKDGFVSDQKIEDSKKNLPSQTIFKKIEGMNHSEFGNYGLQSGDNQADLSLDAAINQVSSEMKMYVNW